MDLNIAKIMLDIRPYKGIVVTGDKDNVCAFARFPQHLLHHIIMSLRPIPGPP